MERACLNDALYYCRKRDAWWVEFALKEVSTEPWGWVGGMYDEAVNGTKMNQLVNRQSGLRIYAQIIHSSGIDDNYTLLAGQSSSGAGNLIDSKWQLAIVVRLSQEIPFDGCHPWRMVLRNGEGTRGVRFIARFIFHSSWSFGGWWISGVTIIYCFGTGRAYGKLIGTGRGVMAMAMEKRTLKGGLFSFSSPLNILR